MTKETIIQAHWIELGFEPCRTEADGFVDESYLPDDIDRVKLEFTLDATGFPIARPISLKSVDFNNIKLFCFECEIEMPVKEIKNNYFCENCGLKH